MYLGIDLGTSELKVLLLDDAQRILASVAEPLVVSRPQPLWSEQDPADWWQACDKALLRLRADQRAAMAAVRAIGPSGQMHGAVLLDHHGDVLRPTILWNDGRSAAQCVELEAAVPKLHAIAGNLAMPGFTAPKLLWVRQHEPHLFAQTARVLLPKDWLRLRLTGEYASDMSDASGTLWLDVGRRCWSEELLAACGLRSEHMPRLVEGSAVAGLLRAELAQRWGMRANVMVAGGAGDNAASAIGVGVVRPNQGFVSLGTSGVIFLSGERFLPNPRPAVHAFCHALPGRWHQMSVMLSAAGAVRWVRKLLGLASEDELLQRVALLTPAQRSRTPLFLPYLSGERTPHNDPHAQGVLFGLTHEHDAAAIGYAVLEGVGFGLADGWSSLAVQPADVEALAVVGGGAVSSLWTQLLASTLGVAMRVHAGSEAGGALGAARLAWLADGGNEAEVCASGAVIREAWPDPAESERLAPRRERFRALYPLLRDEFGKALGPDALTVAKAARDTARVAGL